MINLFEQGKKIQNKDIRQLEELIDLKYPSEYRSFLLNFNGGKPESTIYIFNESDKEQSSDIRWFLGIGGEYSDIHNVMNIYKLDEKRMPSHIVPIAYDSGGNQICISCSGDDVGKIYFWDHENEVDYTVSDDSDYSNLHLIANSFNEFLDGLMTEEEYDAYEEAQKEKR